MIMKKGQVSIMKTIEELLKQIEASEVLKKEISAINTKEGFAAFMKAQGCDASVDDFMALIKAEDTCEGEISDDAVEAVAGGVQAKKEDMDWLLENKK